MAEKFQNKKKASYSISDHKFWVGRRAEQPKRASCTSQDREVKSTRNWAYIRKDECEGSD